VVVVGKARKSNSPRRQEAAQGFSGRRTGDETKTLLFSDADNIAADSGRARRGRPRCVHGQTDQGTPAVFVNGSVLANRSFAGFQTVIDAALNKFDARSAVSMNDAPGRHLGATIANKENNP
jgi:hypothetical protein